MRHLIIPLLALGACTVGPADPVNPPGGQFGEEDAFGCVEVAKTPLALDEVSSLGFAPQAVLDLVDGERAATLTWTKGGTTGVTVSAVSLGEAWEITYEAESVGDLAYFCPETVGVSATLEFATEDGSFAETWDVRLESEDGLVVHHLRELVDVAGSFDLADHVDLSGYEETWVYLELTFEGGAVSGEIEAVGQSSEPGDGGNDGSVSATNHVVATFE